MRLRSPISALFVVFYILVFNNNIVAQNFIIKNYDIELKLLKNGDFNIRERIDVDFLRKSRGIQKFIPSRVKHKGTTKKISLNQIEVADENYALYDEKGFKVIRIGDNDKYIKGFKSYDFSYKVSNAMLYEENHDELFYNVVSEWDVAIEKVSYKIILHDTLTIPFNNFKVFTGQDNEDSRDATIEKQENIFFGKSLIPLKPHDNISVAIKLPKEFIDSPPPSLPKIPIYKKDKLWAIPLAFITAFIAFFMKSRRGDGDKDVSDRYFPPDGFSPAEVGTYYDGIVHTEDIVSLIPYWAQQGFVSITNNNLEGKENDIYFRKIKNLPHGSPEYQKIVFDGLFEEGSMVMLTELKNEIYRSHYKAEKEIKENLKRRELYDQEYCNIFKTGKLIFLFFILFGLSVLIFILTPYVLTGVFTLFFGLISFIFHFVPAKKSKKGIAIRNHLIGLRNFLKNIDAQKTEELLLDHPNYFEEIFPYAVAFGLEKSWIQKIDTLNLDAPRWYTYEDINVSQNVQRASMTSFGNEFSIPTIKSVFTSAPTSPGGSPGGGFSGGRAGGGFGGGGSSW